MAAPSQRLLLIFALISRFLLTFAQDETSAPTPTTTSSYPAFPSMSATDGGGVAEGGVGSSNNGLDNSSTSGGDHSAWSLSTGGVVGLTVGIALVVIIIAALWTLWYLTKKKNWDIRASIKRASRRLTGRKSAPPPSRANRRGTVMLKDPKNVDLERGLPGGGGRSQQPHKGWLANEKELSRERSATRQ